jgi:phosphoribosylaminoimidazolecarboxamide formyltransferase/IMP cyclohydrolase
VDREAVTGVRRALLSVWEKTGLVALGGALASHGIDLVASGGTARALADAGLAVTPVESVTGFPELLEGRVKTLHPAIHAAILARRSRPDDMAELARHGIGPIDMVVVDLYPFAHAEELGAADDDARTELIDIGGVALIRAAAKNWRDVAVVTDRGDYDAVIKELSDRGGALTGETRRRLAAKAIRLTASYDARIAEWLGHGEIAWPERWTIGAELVAPLRYGENPHQPSALYRDRIPRPGDVVAAEIIQGKELSYNNYLDLESARRLARDLRALAPELAHCVIVKHTIPCGAATAGTIQEAYRAAHAADPVSAFGGVVALTEPVDGSLAALLAETFLEVVWAPGFETAARETLAPRKGLRLLAGPVPGSDEAVEFRRVGGGILLQRPNRAWLPGGRRAHESDIRVATHVHPTQAQLADLLFAWTVCRAVASNAIVLARDQTTIGIGGGQTSRVGAVDLAVRLARDLGHETAGSVLASDGFFPFADGVEKAAAAEVTAIIQPGGSRRDAEVVAAAEEAGIAMVFTGLRQFRH